MSKIVNSSGPRIVCIVGKDLPVRYMFESEGWIVVPDDEIDEYELILDLICFTGGADVHPHWYGEEPDGNGYYDWYRDEREIAIWGDYKGKVPFVGICRGGQFLNVMNDGKLIQHIDGHSMGVRTIRNHIFEGSYPDGFTIHEDHHQGMLLNETGRWEAIADDPRTNTWEIVWYPDTKSLCFQPHPEWGHEPTKKLFFELIEEYIR